VTDGTADPSDRRCPLSLAPCAGAYWRGPCRAFGPEAPGSIRRRRHPGLPPVAGSLCRRTTGTRPVHSHVFSCRESTVRLPKRSSAAIRCVDGQRFCPS